MAGDDDGDSGILIAKIVSMPVIFIITLVASGTPWALKRFRVDKAAEFIGLGACLASGVIVGSAFSHLLPDATAAFSDYFVEMGTRKSVADYPFAPLICTFVLLLLVCVDSLFVKGGLAQGAHSHSHDHNSENNYVPEGRHTPRHNHLIPSTPKKQVSQVSPDSHRKTRDSIEPNSTPITPKQDVSVLPLSPSKVNITEETSLIITSSDSELTQSVGTESFHKYTDVDIHSDLENGNGIDSDSSDSIEHATSNSASLKKIHHRQDVAQAWIFYIALAIHAVFDGLSIGAEQSSSGFYGILIAVLVHKGLDGFTLGIPIYYANFSRNHTIAALVFSALMTPVGTAIGMGVTSQFHGPSGNLGMAIILSLSSGSFFYIGLMEMLPAGLADGKKLRTKLLLVILGWILMVVLAIWT